MTSVPRSHHHLLPLRVGVSGSWVGSEFHEGWECPDDWSCCVWSLERGRLWRKRMKRKKRVVFTQRVGQDSMCNSKHLLGCGRVETGWREYGQARGDTRPHLYKDKRPEPSDHTHDPVKPCPGEGGKRGPCGGQGTVMKARCVSVHSSLPGQPPYRGCAEDLCQGPRAGLSPHDGSCRREGSREESNSGQNQHTE